MKVDKRILIGGAVLAGGFLFMRRASAATVAPSIGSVASGGGASPFQSNLLQALTAAAAPAPSPTYTAQSAPTPMDRLVSAASAVVAPAPTPAPYRAPAPAPIQSGNSWGTYTDAGVVWSTPETYG